MTTDRWHKLAAKGIEEVQRFLLMFVYLWLVFGLFELNQAVILGKTEISFLAQGFALINAAILAKVMLIAEGLKLGHRFERLPTIYSIGFKSGVFAALFMAFHVIEKLVVAVIAGKPAGAAFSLIGGGTWAAVACVWAIMAVSLLPFFTLREISLELGEGELWKLMFHRRPADRAAANGASQIA